MQCITCSTCTEHILSDREAGGAPGTTKSTCQIGLRSTGRWAPSANLLSSSPGAHFPLPVRGFRPASAAFGQPPIDFRECWPNLGRSLANVAQLWRISANRMSESGEPLLNCGEICPELAKFQPTLAKLRPHSSGFGTNRINSLAGALCSGAPRLAEQALARALAAMPQGWTSAGASAMLFDLHLMLRSWCRRPRRGRWWPED